MTFRIGERTVGPAEKPFVILEAGINHNGDIGLARQMIRAAREAGADAIKFQTFKAAEFVADRTQLFTYTSQGRQVTEPMLDMFQRYEFSPDAWREIHRTCDAEGIVFMSTPQNESDMEFLLELGVPALKVGSDDFTNLPLIKRYAGTGLPLILSCGMSDLGEVHDALAISGALDGAPVALMLCTSQYPTPAADANLSRLLTLKSAFQNLLLGFSDHTQGPLAAALACGLGARIFEKHFTISQDLPGPDHWFSENPSTAAEWVAAIQTASVLLGSARVAPTAAELDMRPIARRSVTAIRDIRAGEVLSSLNVGLRRPGTGLAPKMLDLVLGRRARRPIARSAQLDLGDFE